MGFLKDMFTDYKPVIINGINEAINKEKEVTLEQIGNLLDLLANGEDFGVNTELENSTHMQALAYSLKTLTTINIDAAIDKYTIIDVSMSSRAMYQTLLSLTYNAKYSSEKDTATGVFNDYEISLIRMSNSRCLCIDATYNGKLELFEEVISEFKKRDSK